MCVSGGRAGTVTREWGLIELDEAGWGVLPLHFLLSGRWLDAYSFMQSQGRLLAPLLFSGIGTRSPALGLASSPSWLPVPSVPGVLLSPGGG